MKMTDPPKGSELGKLVHAMVLEPSALVEDYAVAEFDNFRTKAAQEWKAEVEGRGVSVVTQALWNECEALGDAVVSNPVVANLLKWSKTEQSFYSEMTVGTALVPVKCRVDGIATLPNGEVWLWDLKTTSALTPEEFVRTEATKLNYPGQAAFYTDIVESHGVKPDGWLWVCVNDKTADVFVVRCPDEVLATGRALYKRCLAACYESEMSRVWPGAVDPTVIHDVEFPSWYGGEDNSVSDEDDSSFWGGE